MSTYAEASVDERFENKIERATEREREEEKKSQVRESFQVSSLIAVESDLLMRG
jgi:hypothetical protein